MFGRIHNNLSINALAQWAFALCRFDVQTLLSSAIDTERLEAVLSNLRIFWRTDHFSDELKIRSAFRHYQDGAMTLCCTESNLGRYSLSSKRTNPYTKIYAGWHPRYCIPFGVFSAYALIAGYNVSVFNRYLIAQPEVRVRQCSIAKAVLILCARKVLTLNQGHRFPCHQPFLGQTETVWTVAYWA